MSEGPIDKLNIEVGGEFKQAKKGLTDLAKSMEDLRKATAKIGATLNQVDFDQFGAGVKKLAVALQPLGGFKSQAGGLINALGRVGKTMEHLGNLQGIDSFAGQVERLSEALDPFADFKTHLGATLDSLSELSLVLDQLESAAPRMDDFAKNIMSLTQALKPMEEVDSKLGAVLNQLSRLAQVTQQVNEAFKDVPRMGQQIKGLAEALEPLSEVKSSVGSLLRELGALPDTIKEFSRAMGSLREFETNLGLLTGALQNMVKIDTNVGTLLTHLRRLSSTLELMEKATPGLGEFEDSMVLLSTALKPLSDLKIPLGSTLNNLERLPDIMRKLSAGRQDAQTTSRVLGEFGNTMRGLADIKTPLTTINRQLNKLVDVFLQINETKDMGDFGEIMRGLVDGLRPLTELKGMSTKGNVITYLAKIPKIAKDMEGLDMEGFADVVERLAVALAPLATEMDKVGRGFSAMPMRIQKLITEHDKLNNRVEHTTKGYNKMSKSIIGGLFGFRIGYGLINRTRRLLMESFRNINAYIENLHLFRLAMEGAADSGLKFAQEVQARMGIDMKQWLGYQSVFQNMAKGFGITNDRAAIMSRTLTQLGYDLAAVFNVDYDTSMRKLESAIAGQPRPMREWGYDISQTTLKMVAQNLGIEKSVELMTQLEKSQLRFIQIMETSRMQGYLGDMARTMLTPANASRILTQELLQLSRAIGEIMVPAALRFIPVIIAVTRVTGEFLRTVAEMLGFELPVVDYDSVNAMRGAIGGLTDDFDDLDESVSRAKNTISGIDVLNVLSPDKSDVGDLVDALGLDLSKYSYDFLGNVGMGIDKLTTEFRSYTQGLRDALLGLLGFAQRYEGVLYSLGETILGTYVSLKMVKWGTGKVGAFMSRKDGLSDQTLEALTKERDLFKRNIGVSLNITGISLGIGSGFKIGAEGLSTKDLAQAIISVVATTAGGLLLLGTGPLGWTVGVGIGVIANLVGFTLGRGKKLADEVKKAFYQGRGEMTIKGLKVGLDSPEVSRITGRSGLDVLETTTVGLLRGVFPLPDEFQEITYNMNLLESSIRQSNNELSRVKELWEAGGDAVDDYYKRLENLVDNITNALRDKLAAATEMILAMAAPEILTSEFVVTMERSVDKATENIHRLGELTKRSDLTQSEFQERMDLEKMFGLGPMEQSIGKIDAVLKGLDLEGPEAIGAVAVNIGDALKETITEQEKVTDAIVEQFKFLDVASGGEYTEAYTNAIEVTRRLLGDRIDLLESHVTQVSEELYTELQNRFVDMFLKESVEKGLPSVSKALEKVSISSAQALGEDYGLRMKDLVESTKQMSRILTWEQGGILGSLWDKAYSFLLGTQMGEGVREGLIEALSQDEAWLPVIEAWKKWWDIRSPSRTAMRELGYPMGKGVELGLEKSLKESPLWRSLTTSKQKIQVEVFGPHQDEGLFDMKNVVGQTQEVQELIELPEDTEIREFFEDIAEALGKLHEENTGEYFREFLDQIADKGIETSFGNISTNADRTVKDVYQSFSSGAKSIMKDWKGVAGYFRDGIYKPILDETSSLLSTSLAMYKKEHGLMKLSWADFSDWVVNKPIKNMGEEVGKSLVRMGRKFSHTMSDLVMDVTGLKDAFLSIRNPITDVLDAIIRELIRMAAQEAFIWIARTAITAAGGEVAGAAFSKIARNMFAEGGFPQQGSMFIARESGPELVGTIGGRTAVANNDQIVRAVSEGVYQAVVDAMRDSSGGKDRPVEVRVTLDGKDVTRAVERVQGRRGLELLPT